MDYFIKEALESLGKSKTELNQDNIDRIREEFPVPREYDILWADVAFSTRSSGIVFTDAALVIRADKKTLKSYNDNQKNKKERQSCIYHLIKWEYLDMSELHIYLVGGVVIVEYNKQRVLELDRSRLLNFTKSYADSYERFVKISAVSADAVFAELEAIVAENFAVANGYRSGHGQMAEEATMLIEKMTGHQAEVLGRDNTKDGPDLLVDGVYIQSKYSPTGKKCVDGCFDKDTGIYRYFNPTDGKPMVLEVPKDKYADAILEFRKKILEGKVPGVSDPNDASKYVKQGRLTYQQALNLCKPGTIESLTYDAATGIITCSFAFGISFLATMVMTYYQTGDKKAALTEALYAGIQVFGLSFFSHILTSQVARTNLTRSLIPFSSYVVNKMGYKATQNIVNAIRTLAGKKAISGAAASKQLAKMLRSNIVTAALTFVVFAGPDTYRIFNKKISSAQYTKNMLSLIGTMASAGGGTLAAAAITAKVGAAAGTAVAPGVGTAIGIGGGLVGGVAGGTIIKVVGDKVREDDSVIISRMFNSIVLNFAYEYLLQEVELDAVIEELNNLKSKDFKKLFAEIQSSKKQERVICDFIRHYFEEVIRRRPMVDEPTADEITDVLNDIGNADLNILSDDESDISNIDSPNNYTKPSKAAQQRRLDAKTHRTTLKRTRRKKFDEE